MPESFDPALLANLRAAVSSNPVIATLSNGKPNWITSISENGVWLETEATRSKGIGPQLVPAWMLNTAWSHLQSTGSLTNKYLVSTDGLNIKRSSAVCALLAQLPVVEVVSSRPISLRMKTGHERA